MRDIYIFENEIWMFQQFFNQSIVKHKNKIGLM